MRIDNITKSTVLTAWFSNAAVGLIHYKLSLLRAIDQVVRLSQGNRQEVGRASFPQFQRRWHFCLFAGSTSMLEGIQNSPHGTRGPVIFSRADVNKIEKARHLSAALSGGLTLRAPIKLKFLHVAALVAERFLTFLADQDKTIRTTCALALSTIIT